MSRRSFMVKTRTSVREIPGSIPTMYEFSVWKESGAPPYKCACALLVFNKYLSSLLYTSRSEPALVQNTKQQTRKYDLFFVVSFFLEN